MSTRQVAFAIRLVRTAGSADQASRDYAAQPGHNPAIAKLLRGFAANKRSSFHVDAVPTQDDPPLPNLPKMTEADRRRALEAGWFTVHRSR